MAQRNDGVFRPMQHEKWRFDAVVDGHLAHLRRGWSTLVKTHDCRLGQRNEVELEADGRRRRVRCHRQAVGADRKHCEEVTVRVVTRRWARTAIARCAEVRTSLKRLLWQA